MPPKPKYTREQILDCAYELVRAEGIESLSARNLAARLGTSTAPIFTAFSSIEELTDEIKARAFELYSSYIDEGLRMKPPFKGTGLMYIKFAKDEPNLFKMLFMSATHSEETNYFPSGDKNEGRIRENIEQRYLANTEEAKRLYNHLSVYTHGLAVMFASGNAVFSDEDISKMLTEVFISLSNSIFNKE